jgi:hypothetical protein
VNACALSENPTAVPEIDIDLLNARDFFDFYHSKKLSVFACLLDPVAPTSPLEPDGPTISLQQVVSTKTHVPSQTPLDSRGVPLKYAQFDKVFALKSEPPKALPPHREYDLPIDLDESKTLPLPSKIYALSPDETCALQDYITNALARGWIRPSSSPLGAPCFYVKKPNGGLRLCVDYRGLNAITRKNGYPLPLISDLLERLQSARIFSSLDLPDAYHLVRIRAGDEWKTAFRCKFGSFEYNVVSFGLTNAPATFQHFMNDIFRDMSDFVVVYLDNILIFSSSPAEHEDHVRCVLARLDKFSLVVNPAKCSFDITEIDFLGHVISPLGISMDPAKVATVSSWTAPRSVKDVQIFLGFANYYRRFIWRFSQLTHPLTSLLRKNVPFVWSTECQIAFDSLKARFTSAPILRHYDFSRPTVLECDASDFAIAGVLSQRDVSGVLHPVAYHSRKLLPAEANYDIHDKELLAIIECLQAWRHFVIGATADDPLTILSDHKNLLHFTSRVHLNRRQYRWAAFLSQFSFVIKHVAGSVNGKADALSRRTEYLFAEGDPHVTQNCRQIFTDDESSNVMRLHNPISVETASLVSSFSSSFLKDVHANLESCPLYQRFCKKELSEEYSLVDGLLFYRGLLVVPSLELQLQILQARHASPVAGHFGVNKTVELVSRDYFWPGLRRCTRKFIRGCEVCCRAKSSRHKPYGLLRPLPVPQERWQDISLDFVTDLPPSQSFDSILVVKDRLTKMAHYIPCHKTTSGAQTAELFLANIFKLHGCPRTIVSDRGVQFTSSFWKRFFELLNVDLRFSTAFHPETDGSTEVVNQVLEQYLRIFCSYKQSDWSSLLPLAEFTYNNSVNSTTNMTPFFANNGLHPLFEPSSVDIPSVPAAELRVVDFASLIEELRSNLKVAQERYSKYVNLKRTPIPSLKVGSLVYLDRRNIKTSRPSRKLDDKKLGPFKIIQVINPVAFKLALPSSMKVHPVFHSSLLEPKAEDTFPTQQQAPPMPIVVEGNQEFVVRAILDSRVIRGVRRFLVDWEGYSPDDRTWEPESNLRHCRRLLTEFKSKHSLD